MTAGEPLLAAYRGIVCDLDGVVYRGPDAVPHAVAALTDAVGHGAGIIYATNNGSRPPADVAEHLTELGLRTPPESVVTSAQAAARELRDRLGEGAPVLAVGGPGVPLAIEQAALRAVTTEQSAAGEQVAGVLQSYGKDVSWHDLAEIAYVVNAGALWVASNDDRTIPTARGTAPGNGTLVAAVRAAVSVDPIVVGKPNTPLYDVSAQVLHTDKAATLAIGDRLDTDIEGANRAGIDALLVLTGVDDVVAAACAPALRRPRYLVEDLRALAEPYEDATAVREAAAHIGRCGGAEVRVEGGEFRVADHGTPIQRARALLAACWSAADADETPERAAIEAADPTRAGSPS